jgi:hypothetical protein
MPRSAALKPDRGRKIHNEQWNMSDDCDEGDGFYAYLVRCARASERITPEGLEQVYAMSISVSDTAIDCLVAAGELEPGTLRPLRSDFAMEPPPKQAITD